MIEPICGDRSSTLNPGLVCRQPASHKGPCGNGRQMWWSDAREAVEKIGYDKGYAAGLAAAASEGTECWVVYPQGSNAADATDLFTSKEEAEDYRDEMCESARLLPDFYEVRPARLVVGEKT